jgi:hypothetical protein
MGREPVTDNYCRERCSSFGMPEIPSDKIARRIVDAEGYFYHFPQKADSEARGKPKTGKKYGKRGAKSTHGKNALRKKRVFAIFIS